jgi:hypothetical protein
MVKKASQQKKSELCCSLEVFHSALILRTISSKEELLSVVQAVFPKVHSASSIGSGS